MDIFGRADEGGQDADGDLHGQQVPGHVVHQQQKGGPAEKAPGHEVPVIAAQNLSAQMGHHQPYPADHAREGHAGGSDQGGRKEQGEAHPAGVHPQGPGFAVPQAQQVQLPPEQEQGHQAHRHGQEGQGNVAKPGPGQGAHEPVGDLRELVAGIGHQFDIGGAGVEQGGEMMPAKMRLMSLAPGAR